MPIAGIKVRVALLGTTETRYTSIISNIAGVRYTAGFVGWHVHTYRDYRKATTVRHSLMHSNHLLTVGHEIVDRVARFQLSSYSALERGTGRGRRGEVFN